MTTQEQRELRELDAWIHKHIFEADLYVGVKKRGLWYRPDAKGYTDRQSEAGRYTRAEAARHKYPKSGSKLNLGPYDDAVTSHEFEPERYTTDPAASREVERKCLDSLLELGCGDPIVSKNGKNYWIRTVRAGRYIEAEAETLELAWALFAKKLFS